MQSVAKRIDGLAKRSAAILAVLLIGLFPAELSAQSKPKATDIGVYVWGGLLQEGTGPRQFARSVEFLLDRGFTSIRFATAGSTAEAYHLAVADCPAQKADLACFLRQQIGSPTFDDPRLKSLYITLEDTRADWKQMSGSGIPDVVADTMRAEYDFAFDYLAQRFGKRAMPITILNWEGDNQIYCGAAYQFATQAAFRQTCLAKENPTEKLSRFLAWMNIRQQAVDAARRRHPGFDLRLGFEVSNMEMFLRDCQPAGECAGFGTVLNTIAKARKRVPLCSYSAYDSLNHGTIARDMPRLLAVCDKVILGEVGFRLAGNNMAAAATKHDAFVSAIRPYQARIPAIIYWNGFEASDSRNPGFGLYTDDGKPLMIDAVRPSLAKLR